MFCRWVKTWNIINQEGTGKTAYGQKTPEAAWEVCACWQAVSHMAETMEWISNIWQIDNFNFIRNFSFKQLVAASWELLQLFQIKPDNAIDDLPAMSNEDFNKKGTVIRGDK